MRLEEIGNSNLATIRARASIPLLHRLNATYHSCLFDLQSFKLVIIFTICLVVSSLHMRA